MAELWNYNIAQYFNYLSYNFKQKRSDKKNIILNCNQCNYIISTLTYIKIQKSTRSACGWVLEYILNKGYRYYK